MKKIIFTITMSSLLATTYSQAWMKGGNNPSANPFIIGSNTNDAIGFETNNIQRMTLDANGQFMFNAITPMVLAGAGTSQFTIRSGTANAILSTTSGGTTPRIYLETTNPLVTNQAICHSVPSLLGSSLATSGFMWNNISFGSFQSDFHINTRTTIPLPVGINGNVLSVTKNSGRIGILNNNPQNRLEITSLVGTDPQPAGLRFTNLTSASTAVAGTGKVLSVDANGDVILVTDLNTGGGGGGTGYGPCATGGVPLTVNSSINLSGFNFVFDGGGNVGIGTGCSPFARFQTLGNGNTPATTNIWARNSSAQNLFRIYDDGQGEINTYNSSYSWKCELNNSAFTGNMEGFRINSTTGNVPAGGFARGFAASVTGNFNGRNIVVGSFPLNNDNGSLAENIAYHTNFNANASYNTGLFVNVFNNASEPTNVIKGIHVTVPSSTANPNSLAAQFNGDVDINGNLTATTGTVSDQQFKENISTITNATSLLNSIQPRVFNFKTSDYPYMNLSSGNHYGVIAQEIETIIPEVVNDKIQSQVLDTAGNILIPALNYKTVNYSELIPVLIKGFQEQNNLIASKDSMINALNDRLTNLENCINNLSLCSPSHTMQNQNLKQETSVELKDIQSIVLDQNLPNPFAEQTTITYSLSDDVQRAQMLFYNSTGKLINSMELSTAAGKGQLNVFANDLSNGVYTYSLVVDGKIIDTKRMIKNK